MNRDGWRRWACRSRNCKNGPTSTRAPRRLMGRPTSRGEFARGAKRGPVDRGLVQRPQSRRTVVYLIRVSVLQALAVSGAAL